MIFLFHKINKLLYITKKNNTIFFSIKDCLFIYIIVKRATQSIYYIQNISVQACYFTCVVIETEKFLRSENS